MLKFALLFLVNSDQEQINTKTPFIFTLKPGYPPDAIFCWSKGGPSFGFNDIMISDKCDKSDKKHNYKCWSKLTLFENKSFPDVKLCGGHEIIWDPDDSRNWRYGFNVKEYEVWQLLN